MCSVLFSALSLYRDTVKATGVAFTGSRGMNILSEFLMFERLSLRRSNPDVDWIFRNHRKPDYWFGDVIDF